MIMAYDPRKPYLSGEQYVHNPDYLTPDLAERVSKDVRTLCTALGYDLNTVEFAIKDGIPYAIDFMNPAPDAEIASVGEFYHNWIIQAVTDLIFKKLSESRETSLRYRWDAFLNPQVHNEKESRVHQAVVSRGKAKAVAATSESNDSNKGVAAVNDVTTAVAEAPKRRTTRRAKSGIVNRKS